MKNKYMENERLSLLLFFSVAVLYAIIYMTKNCYSAAMVRLVEEGTLTKSQTGTISALFYLVYGPFQIVGGIAADKYSPYKLIAIGFIGAAISNALIVLNDNYYFMMIVWTLNGIVQFGVWPAMFKIVSTSLSPVHRHDAVFYISFASTAGLILSYLLAGVVSGWRINFIVSAIALGVASLYWIVAGKYFDKKMVDEEPVHHGIPHLPEVKKPEVKYEGSFLKLLLTSGMVLVLPVIVLQAVFSLGVQGVAPSMLAESYDNISSSVASFLTIIPIVFGVIGKFIVKGFYKRKIYNECMFMSINLLLLVPLCVGMLFVGKISVWLMAILVSLVVMTASVSSILPFTYMSVRFSRLGKGATFSGLINSMSAFGIVVSNYVSPRIADAFNNWVPVILVWMAFALFSSLISFVAFFSWRKFIKDPKFQG